MEKLSLDHAPVPPLDIVMPAYNEAGAIEAAVRDVARDILAWLPGSRLLVVDDGSRDATGEILDRLAGEVEGLVVIHQRNQGHGPALARGFSEAKAPWVFTLDSDRQQKASDFRLLWEKREGRAMVAGIRYARQEGFIRKVVTTGLRAVILGIFGVAARDPNVPFKLFRRELWDQVAPLVGPKPIMLSVGLLVAASGSPGGVEWAPVSHLARTTGHTTLFGPKLARFCLLAMDELWRYRRAGLGSSRAGKGGTR